MILASYNIKSASLERNGTSILEEFKIDSQVGAPYKFTLSHKGNAVSMANAINSYISSTSFVIPEPYGEFIMMQMSDAAAAVNEALTSKSDILSA